MPTTTDPGAGRPAPSDDELARLAREGGPPSDAMQALYERLGAVMRTLRRPARRAARAARRRGRGRDAGAGAGLPASRLPLRPRRFGRRGRRPLPGVPPAHVLRDWLSKYERRLRRAERRLDRSKDAAEELDERVLQGEKSSPGGPTGDPAALAVWEEDCSRLEGALGGWATTSDGCGTRWRTTGSCARRPGRWAPLRLGQAAAAPAPGWAAGGRPRRRVRRTPPPPRRAEAPGGGP